MGRQAAHFAMGLSGFASFLTLIGLFSRLHHLSFYVGGSSKAMEIDVYALTGQVEIANSDWCGAIEYVYPGSISWCADLKGGHDLMDLSQRFCATAFSALFKNSCSGFNNAYAVGLALFVFTLVNMVLQGISTFMLYQYTYKKPQKKFREVSMILVVIGTCLVAVCLIVYLPAVGMQLDSITVAVPGGSYVLDVAKGTGIAIGYMIMWIAVLVQITQVILHRFTKISDEARLADLKMQEQFEAQLADGTGGFGVNSAQLQGAYGGGYGNPPGSGYGYPPLPPQSGGGYLPQSGAGYPPQSGGGYPPQSGGGYAHQTGGGYIPQSGAGYPPQSGGGFPASQQYAGNPQMPMSGQQWQQPAAGYSQRY